MILCGDSETILLGHIRIALCTESLRHSKKGRGIDSTLFSENSFEFVVGVGNPLLYLGLYRISFGGKQFHPMILFQTIGLALSG
jgi:hypothetical protein